MQSIRRSRRNTMRINAEINFTNLIDVAFVLLIIFMITAPIMQGGIEVQLPEAQAAPLQQSEALTVSIDLAGQLFFEETPVGMDEIGDLVASHMERRPQDYVALKVDGRAPFEPFAQVLGIMASRNITNVSVPVLPQNAGTSRAR
jgi:biopolymer transport protein TolR